MTRASGHPVVLRCAPGLARVLQLEMRFRKMMPRGVKPLVLRQRNHDLIFLQSVVSHKAGEELRIAEEAGDCLMYGRFKVSESQLDRLADELSRVRRPLRLAVTADGQHFNRMDMERFFARALKNRDIRLQEEAEQMLWLYLVDEKFYVVLQSSFYKGAPFRHLRRAEREGSLPVTIAAAMAFSAGIAEGEAVLDPVCGSGTLLAEAYGLQPGLSALYGFDIDDEAVRLAGLNLKKTPVTITRGDGGKTGLEDASVDVALANLPFGKQFGDKRSNPDLYRDLLAEMQRVLKPKGRAVVLTSDIASFDQALGTFSGVQREELFTVRVRGESSRAYKISFRK